MVSLEERTPLKLLQFSVLKFRRKLSKNLHIRYPNYPLLHKGCVVEKTRKYYRKVTKNLTKKA
jgi:hypothetical protein